MVPSTVASCKGSLIRPPAPLCLAEALHTTGTHPLLEWGADSFKVGWGDPTGLGDGSLSLQPACPPDLGVLATINKTGPGWGTPSLSPGVVAPNSGLSQSERRCRQKKKKNTFKHFPFFFKSDSLNHTSPQEAALG